eukprot:8498643-Pyramimonas_sp.AAC.2
MVIPGADGLNDRIPAKGAPVGKAHRALVAVGVIPGDVCEGPPTSARIKKLDSRLNPVHPIARGCNVGDAFHALDEHDGSDPLLDRLRGAVRAQLGQ